MQQHIGTYSMNALCEALSVSRSGFHAWHIRLVNQAKLQLNQAVNHCHSIHKSRAGAPSLHADLQAQGICVSVRTVDRIMQALSLRAKYNRKFKRTTDSNHQYGASPNLFNRDFTATRPNQVWMGDITAYRSTGQALYSHGRRLVLFGGDARFVQPPSGRLADE